MSTNHSSLVTEPALKPCPFCGRPGAIFCLEDEPGSPASFWVNCSCGMETRERRTEAEAIALWNTRAAPARCDLARITELRVFEHGGFRAIVDGVGGWGSTQLAAIQNATANAKKLNASTVTSTVQPPVENKVWPTGTGNTPQDVQLTSLVTRPDGGDPA